MCIPDTVRWGEGNKISEIKAAGKVKLRADPSGMTVGTGYLGQISYIDGMLESRRRRGGHAGRAFGFGQESVALSAVLADDLAVGAEVLAVMATEAAVVVIVP